MGYELPSVDNSEMPIFVDHTDYLMDSPLSTVITHQLSCIYPELPIMGILLF